tara:strand:+ start:8752 stop:9597 length:846 start_codon:yes stop_codon:yes gene_type:complete
MSINLGGVVQSINCGEGNKFFQLFTMLIYADINELYIEKKKKYKILDIDYKPLEKNKQGDISKNFEKVILSSTHFDDNGELKFFGRNKRYFVTDFFQNANYLNKHYDILKKYINTEKIYKSLSFDNINITDNDLLCILRMKEFKGNELVDKNYFLNIFKNNYNKIYFLIYPHDDCDLNIYIKQFEKYKDKILFLSFNDKIKDFYIVNKFKHIAGSVSTFNWWSIYLCNNIENKKIYMPLHTGKKKKYNQITSRNHCKDLWNIRNNTIPIEHDFVKVTHLTQ